MGDLGKDGFYQDGFGATEQQPYTIVPRKRGKVQRCEVSTRTWPRLRRDRDPPDSMNPHAEIDNIDVVWGAAEAGINAG